MAIILHVICTCVVIVTKSDAFIAFAFCVLTLFVSRVLVQEWQKSLNQKLEPFLQEKELLKDEEVVQLGKKDPEAYPLIIYYNLLAIYQQWPIIIIVIINSSRKGDLWESESPRNYTEKIDYHLKKHH